MNLVEVTVAAAVFVTAASGSAQLSGASARALQQQRHSVQQQHLIEAQFLAVAPLLKATQRGPAPAGDCATAARWMQAQLAQGLPPVAAGVSRQLLLSPSGQQLQLRLASGSGSPRQRLYSPAAYGLCGPATATELTNEDPTHAKPTDAEPTHAQPTDARPTHDRP